MHDLDRASWVRIHGPLGHDSAARSAECLGFAAWNRPPAAGSTMCGTGDHHVARQSIVDSDNARDPNAESRCDFDDMFSESQTQSCSYEYWAKTPAFCVFFRASGVVIFIR